MKPLPTHTIGATGTRRAGDQAQVRMILLVLVFFVLGIGVSAFWHSRTARRGPVKPGGEANDQPVYALSDHTKAVLNRLGSPVEIRFYSMLDQATVSPSLFPFAEQINRLLAEFQRQGNGKINVVLYNALSDSTAQSAASDGIKPFNLDKGNACYLGLAVACHDKRETLVELAPEWEQALEFDLTRAIERVARPNPQPKPNAETLQNQAQATQQVLRTIPNLASVSVEQGTQILREAALKEFKAAADEMGVQLAEAQQQLSRAQQSGLESEQQAAFKRLQQVQSRQAEKLKQIAAGLDDQIAALSQLKAK
jgi:hypothetical protein